MNNSKKLKIYREGGFVKRCHARQMHREYLVGQHSFNVAGIIMTFCPSPSLALIKAALWHDVPERFTGDVPTPVKQLAPEIRDLLRLVERRVLTAVDEDFEDTLTDKEKEWLKAADMVELWLWAREEVALGNSAACSLEADAYAIILALRSRDKFPQELFDYVLSENKTDHVFLPDNADAIV